MAVARADNRFSRAFGQGWLASCPIRRPRTRRAARGPCRGGSVLSANLLGQTRILARRAALQYVAIPLVTSASSPRSPVDPGLLSRSGVEQRRNPACERRDGEHPANWHPRRVRLESADDRLPGRRLRAWSGARYVCTTTADWLPLKCRREVLRVTESPSTLLSWWFRSTSFLAPARARRPG